MAELSISVFLLALLLMLTVGAFVPGLKVTRQAEESIASQREVVLAFERLMAEMSLMDRVGVTVGDEALSFLSHEDYRGSDPPLSATQIQAFDFSTRYSVWKKFVILRLRDGKIWRREVPYGGGSDLARIRADALLAVADQTNRQQRVFARDVDEFGASFMGRSRMQLHIRSVHKAAGQPEACDMTFEIVMRGTNG